MNPLSDRINNLAVSQTLAMAALARELKAQGKDIISLSLGEPDFNTPEFIKDLRGKELDLAGFKALVNGIDTTTESGQKLYGSLISLSSSFYDVYGSVEETLLSNRTSLISSLEDFVSSTKSTIQTDTTFKDFSSSFNNMIDAIKLGSEDLSDIGNATINTAQSYLDTVARTAKSSAEIEFAKKVVANKFEGVINAEDITLGTINDTLKISFNEDSVIVKAINDVKNELVYLNQLNTRQTANSNKTLQLQRASIA